VRAIVCAYSEVGHACLSELLALGVDVRLVVTHRDAPGEPIWFGSVAELASSAGIETLMPENVNAPEVVARLAAAEPEVLFSFYFRQLLKAPLLRLPTRAALNMHGSLLPAYRGRAPVNWVLVRGEKETGVTLHYMDEKPDHGEIVAQQSVAIDRDDTALILTRKLALAARRALREAIPLLEAGAAPRIAQDHRRSSYFGGRRPEDGEIDWKQSAESIRNLIRAVTRPWPGAYSYLHGEKLLIWWAETRPTSPGRAPGEIFRAPDGSLCVATGEADLELVEVGRPGGEPLSGADWVRSEAIDLPARLAAAP
jgi:methionyl-tRNA formyltransferase